MDNLPFCFDISPATEKSLFMHTIGLDKNIDGSLSPVVATSKEEKYYYYCQSLSADVQHIVKEYRLHTYVVCGTKDKLLLHTKPQINVNIVITRPCEKGEMILAADLLNTKYSYSAPAIDWSNVTVVFAHVHDEFRSGFCLTTMLPGSAEEFNYLLTQLMTNLNTTSAPSLLPAKFAYGPWMNSSGVTPYWWQALVWIYTNQKEQILFEQDLAILLPFLATAKMLALVCQSWSKHDIPADTRELCILGVEHYKKQEWPATIHILSPQIEVLLCVNMYREMKKKLNARAQIIRKLVASKTLDAQAEESITYLQTLYCDHSKPEHPAGRNIVAHGQAQTTMFNQANALQYILLIMQLIPQYHLIKKEILSTSNT